MNILLFVVIHMDLPFHNNTFAYRITSYLNQPNNFDLGSLCFTELKKQMCTSSSIKRLATHINFVKSSFCHL